MFWNSVFQIHIHNHIALPVRLYSEIILYGLWPVILRPKARGILFLLFQNIISGRLLRRIGKLYWNTLSSEEDDVVLSVVVVVFSQ